MNKFVNNDKKRIRQKWKKYNSLIMEETEFVDNDKKEIAKKRRKRIRQ